MTQFVIRPVVIAAEIDCDVDCSMMKSGCTMSPLKDHWTWQGVPLCIGSREPLMQSCLYHLFMTSEIHTLSHSGTLFVARYSRMGHLDGHDVPWTLPEVRNGIPGGCRQKLRWARSKIM